MSKNMELKGINSVCKNESVADAFKKSGYRLRTKKVSWPRAKKQATVQVDCSVLCCSNVLFAEVSNATE